jgi:predicted nucleotidyltransferase
MNAWTNMPTHSADDLSNPAVRLAAVLRALCAHKDELTTRFAVSSLAVFGSVVREEADAASDVDLLVEFSRPIGLLHLSGTALYLEGLLGRKVDLVLRRALLPELREAILAEAVDAF